MTKPLDLTLAARPALRCRCPDADALGHTHDDTVSASLEAVERPHVDVSTPSVWGSVRLLSASGGLESIWLKPRDGDCKDTTFAMLTPTDARALAALLVRYADTHRETSDE